MRILFVTNMYPTVQNPGFGAFVRQQAEELHRLGHVVDVINFGGLKSRLKYVGGAVKVFQRTRSASYDIVHAHYGLSGFPAWFRVGAPLVLTLHGSDVLGRPLERRLSRVISHFADAVIVVSEEMRRHIPGTVIPCGVDLDFFRPFDRAEARRRLGLPLDTHLVLFPFDPARRLKRYDLARAAVNRLRHEGLSVELVSVFKADNSEMPFYYSAADAMILCSDHEGSPTSVKEALACNLPVVATDVGDLRHVLGAVAGNRITTQDIRDIARSLREVITEVRRERFAGRASMARYHQTRVMRNVLDVYDTVLERRRQTACNVVSN